MKDHIVLSFGPDEAYSRHSEGDFLRLNNGNLLFVYSRFTESFDDDAPSDLVAMISPDEGETWSDPVTAISASMYNTHQVMSSSLMRMQNGDVGLFYLVKLKADDERVFLSRSRDEGKTWYRHIECSLPDRPAYYVVNNDRVERLSSGRLLIPMAYHRGGYSATDSSIHWDGRSFVLFQYSDDDGETWKESPEVVFPPFSRTRTGLQEPGAIELKNGVIWGYARTDQHCQYEFFSYDSGLHWTEAQPSRFTSPASPMKISRHPDTGDLYAVWNPVPNYNGRYTIFPAEKGSANAWASSNGGGRTPLVWAVSNDEGETWSEPKLIEGDPGVGYCYPAVFFTKDQGMLVAYCAGGPTDGDCLARLTIKKIAL